MSQERRLCRAGRGDGDEDWALRSKGRTPNGSIKPMAKSHTINTCRRCVAEAREIGFDNAYYRLGDIIPLEKQQPCENLACDSWIKQQTNKDIPSYILHIYLRAYSKFSRGDSALSSSPWI